MKRIVFLFTLFVFSTMIVLAGDTKPTVSDQNGVYDVIYTVPAQTTDSTTAITCTFTVPPAYFYTDNQVHPVTFAMKLTGTYGAPQTVVYIKAFYNGGSDSYGIDTLRASAAGQGQTDTAGVLYWNTYKKNMRAKLYQIVITNTGKALAGGFVELLFTKPQYLPNFNYAK